MHESSEYTDRTDTKSKIYGLMTCSESLDSLKFIVFLAFGTHVQKQEKHQIHVNARMHFIGLMDVPRAVSSFDAHSANFGKPKINKHQLFL